MDVRNSDARERVADPEGSRSITGSGRVWRVAAQVGTVGIFLLLFVAFLDLARLLLLPVTAAFVIGTMLGPIAERGAARRIPQWVTAIFLVVLFVAAMNLVVLILAAPVSDWVSRGPEIAARLKEKLSLIDYPLQWLRGLRDTLNPEGDHSAPLDLGLSNLIQPALSLLTPAIGYVTPAISQLLIFVGTLFFYLSSRTQVRRATAVLFSGRESRLRTLRILNEVESNLTAYFATVAAIYFVEGVCVGLASYFVGLPNAAAWGTLAFVLCFIPYIGPGIVVLVLFGAGLIQFPTVTQALLAPAIFVGLATVESNFITPTIVGHRLTLSPLAVFLSLVFWAWMWGPVGAFLATPLLIVGLVAAHHIFPGDDLAIPG
jgi:predicted PurR-regulated permease PerM